MSKKILVLDIDGTLTNSNKEISPATKAAVQEALREGHRVMLASGRPTPGMRRYERELELGKYNGFLLSFNGASIIDCHTGKNVHQYHLPLSIVPGIYQFAAEYGCGLMTYQGDEIISAFEPDEYVALESQVNGMRIKVVQKFCEYVDFAVNKCLLTVDPLLADEYVGILKEMYGSIVSVYRSEPFYIEIMPMNVDKATSLDRMVRSMGLDREDVICCGDGFNDIPMVRYAKVGVAMGNAQESLKEVADFIADTNDRDGLVQVINMFVLEQEEVQPI